jgi:hypothetical protein
MVVPGSPSIVSVNELPLAGASVDPRPTLRPIVAAKTVGADLSAVRRLKLAPIGVSFFNEPVRLHSGGAAPRWIKMS